MRLHLRTAAVLAIAVTAAAPAAPAAGAELDARRAQASALADQVERLELQLADSVDRYRDASDGVELARARVAAATLRLHGLNRRLRAGQESLAAVLVESYKRSGTDATAYVLASGSFDELVTQLDLVDRLSESQGDVLGRVEATRREIADVRRQRREAARVAAAELLRLDAMRAGLAHAVRSRTRLLGSVQGRIAQLVAAERRRRAQADAVRAAAQQAAAEAAAAAAEPAAAPAPTPAAPAAAAEPGTTGLATWYGPGFEGEPTASGEPFDGSLLTAAHRTLPLGTRVRVTNLANGASVVVRINDRGPYSDALIDLTRAAADAIGMGGTADVRIVPL